MKEFLIPDYILSWVMFVIQEISRNFLLLEWLQTFKSFKNFACLLSKKIRNFENITKNYSKIELISGNFVFI